MGRHLGESVRSQQHLDLVESEAPRAKATHVPRPRRRGEQGLSSGEVADECTGGDGRQTTRNDDAHVTPWPQDSGNGRQGLGWVVDMLEHSVADDEVKRLRLYVIEQIGRVALDAAHSVTQVGIGSPPLQGRQRIGARIHDGDTMAEQRQTYGISPGSAAQIEHVQSAVGRTSDLGRIDHRLPHQLGADRTHDGHCATAISVISDSVIAMHDQLERAGD